MAPQLTATNGLSRRAAELVHGAGEQLLARAALAGDEHGGVGARDLARRGQERLHRRRAVGQARAVEHEPQVRDLGFQPFLLLALPLALALQEVRPIERHRHLRSQGVQESAVRIPRTTRSRRPPPARSRPRQRSWRQRGSAHRERSSAGRCSRPRRSSRGRLVPGSRGPVAITAKGRGSPSVRSSPPSSSKDRLREVSRTPTRRAWRVSKRRSVKLRASSAASLDAATTVIVSRSSRMLR